MIPWIEMELVVRARTLLRVIIQLPQETTKNKVSIKYKSFQLTKK